MGETPNEVRADADQDECGHRRGRRGGDIRQQRSAQKGGDPARHAETDHGFPIHVAEARVAQSRDGRGAKLSGMDDGRSLRGAKAGKKQHRGRRDAEAHADATVHEVGGRTGERDEDEG